MAALSGGSHLTRERRPAEPSGERDCQLGGDVANTTAKVPLSQLARLPRRLVRKIVVEPTPDGWQARIVGFDARFWVNATSRTYMSRYMAMQAALAASRRCGLPVIAIETLSSSDLPDQAA